VIMPLYRAEKYIRESVASILNQSYTEFELIIIDDCGGDKSLELVKAFHDPRIRIIQNDINRGISRSRNIGIQNARGEYIAILDDDDISSPERFKIEKKYLDEHPEVQCVCGDMRFIDNNGTMIVRTPMETFMNPLRTKAELIFQDVVPNGSAMFRRSFVTANNLNFKDNQYGMEDYRFWSEFSTKGNIASVGEVVYYWRITKDNETSRNLVMENIGRKNNFEEIQRYNISLNGFQLEDDELKTFCNCFSEITKYVSFYELDTVKKVLLKMMGQTENMKADFSREFSFACKRHFARLTEKSEIWGNYE